jgi:sugar phosphate permease
MTDFWKGAVGGEVAIGGDMVANPMEAALVRKLKIRLLPFLFVLFVLAFIDRINLGFAALTMNQELAITTQQFGFAAGIFFWGYFLLEIPSNLVLHRIGARVWIARILITWGAIATLTGLCTPSISSMSPVLHSVSRSQDTFPASFCTWAIGSGKEKRRRRLR